MIIFEWKMELKFIANLKKDLSEEAFAAKDTSHFHKGSSCQLTGKPIAALSMLGYF